MSLLIVIFGPAPNLEVFGQHFGMGGPMQLFQHVTLPYHHPLHLISYTFSLHEHLGRPRGGIGAAERSESPEARLMWIVGFDGQYADFTSFSLGRARIERI